MLDDFREAMRGGMCGIKSDGMVNTCESNKNIWYIHASSLYVWAMMQKLPYKDIKVYITSLDTILNTPNKSDYGYYVVCDIDYNDKSPDKTEQLSLMSNKRKINDND